MASPPLNAARPVAIFAGGFGQAQDFARAEGLDRDGNYWIFVRDPEGIRYLPIRSVAILPGFEKNRKHDLLAPLAEVLEDENGPYVPTTARLKG